MKEFKKHLPSVPYNDKKFVVKKFCGGEQVFLDGTDYYYLQFFFETDDSFYKHLDVESVVKSFELYGVEKVTIHNGDSYKYDTWYFHGRDPGF